MSSSKCTVCNHGSTWHEGKCKLPNCLCQAYSRDISATPIVHIDPSISGTSVAAVEKQIDYKAVDWAGEANKGAILPVTRHEPNIINVLRSAATTAIAQIQAGVWSQADMQRVMDVAAARGCGQCRDYLMAVGNGIRRMVPTGHLSPAHVAEAFGLTYDAEIRSAAYEQIVDMLAKGETSVGAAAATDWVRGWRQFNIVYDTGGLVTPDGVTVPQTVFPRPYLTGAQKGRWLTGDYQAHCSGNIGGRNTNAKVSGDEARERCLEHYAQSGRLVNSYTLMVEDKEPCTCGVYALTNRDGVMGGNAAASVGESHKFANVKGIVVAYGTIQVGSDNESWRATDAMIERLLFYPGIEIDGNPLGDEPTTPYHAAPNYRRLAEDLAELYSCPVTFCSDSIRTWDNTTGDYLWTDVELWTVNPKQSVNWNLPIGSN